MERYGAAEVDCSLSIGLDPSYAKAYHRRANARVKLGKAEEAKRDYEELLKLEPNSKLAQVELNKLEQLIDSRRLVFPIDKKDEDKSKKPLKRIQIEEINDDSADRIEIGKNLEQINQKVVLSSKDEELFKVEKNALEDKITELNIEKPKEIKEEPKAKPNLEAKKILIPNAATNGYQFKKDWQLLGSSITNLAEYLKKIPPADYQKIFLSGLESDTLSKILIIFRDYFVK